MATKKPLMVDEELHRKLKSFSSDEGRLLFEVTQEMVTQFLIAKGKLSAPQPDQLAA